MAKSVVIFFNFSRLCEYIDKIISKKLKYLTIKQTTSLEVVTQLKSLKLEWSKHFKIFTSKQIFETLGGIKYTSYLGNVLSNWIITFQQLYESLTY